MDQAYGSRPKVFCIGFQKTGTTSLEKALQSVGYRVKSIFDRSVPVEELRDTFVEKGLAIAAEYDAVEDMPWPLMFRELDVAFPGSKFILSVRDTDQWYRSIASHFGSRAAPLQQLTYGDDAGAPIGNEERYRAVYDAHNAAVREYFRDRPDDLLEFWLERGHGWPELGAFLELDQIPQGPFVHTNSKSQRKSITKRVKHRLKKIGLPI